MVNELYILVHVQGKVDVLVNQVPDVGPTQLVIRGFVNVMP